MTIFADLETPCLLLDRARLTRNVERMGARCRALGVALRPHVKTPKSIEIAKATHGGTVGPITVSTLKEAEHFASHGFNDILYATAIVPSKIARVHAIQRKTGARVRVVLDSVTVAENLVTLLTDEPATVIDVLIEIDCGEHRSGLAPTSPDLLTIADRLTRSPAANLAGIMAHAGHSYASDDPVKLRALAEVERSSAVMAADTLRRNGNACPMVSIGSTPTILHAAHMDGITEVRCGVYALWDLAQRSRNMCALDDIAATVLATVIGHNRAAKSLVLDAGALAMSKDIGANTFMPSARYGFVCDARTVQPLGSLAITQVHQEHGTVAVDDPVWFARLPIGSLVRVMPNHTCMTCAAYDAFHVVEGERVVDTWGRINGW